MIRRYKKGWQARVSIRDATKRSGWREDSATFPTKREAEAWEAKEKKRERERRNTDDRLTVALYIDKWWPILSNRWKPKTVATYERANRLRIKPTLGQLRIRDITNADIELAMAVWRQDGSRDSTIADTLATLSAFLTHAMRSRAIDVNPVMFIQRPGQNSVHQHPATLSPTQIVQLANACTKYDAHGNVTTTVYRDLTLFLATTGLRYGEAIALQIQDIDLNHKRCVVRQAYVEVDGHLKLQTTKSGKERTAPLPNFLCILLAERINNRNPTELVFEGRLGKPIRNNTFRKAAWLDAKKTDPAFAKLRIHDLRAIALTSLAAADLGLADLQRIAGHSSATTTSVYLRNSKNDLATHAATSFDTEYGEQFDNALTKHPQRPQESEDDQPSERNVGVMRKLADKKPNLRPKYPTSAVLKEVKGDR
ncbi:MAG: site-specific integrase [Candidatus Nanopelagicales bacterium]